MATKDSRHSSKYNSRSNRSAYRHFESDRSDFGSSQGKQKSKGLVENLDLDRFKVHPCPVEGHHNFKRCIYYHNELDRRRDPIKHHYNASFCPNAKDQNYCAKGDRCSMSHTKVEQAYHTEKYRNKFCVHYPNNLNNCPYGKYCSYAHSEAEIKVQMLHNFSKDIDFFLFHYKTQFCPYSQCDDRSKCIYAHNWQDFRRDPSKYYYRSEACPMWDPKQKVSNYETGCLNHVHCSYCHGWKELEYHPDIFKTKPCAANCNERNMANCPYYHDVDDKRFVMPPPTGFLFGPANRTAEKPSHQSPPDLDSADRSRDSRDLSCNEQMMSDKKSYSIFRRLNQQHQYYERPLPGIAKKYSRSQIDELLPTEGKSVPPNTNINLKELTLFIDERRAVDDNFMDQPLSPSKVARRQLTEELDRIESPKRKSKVILGQREEQLLFNEKGWLEDEAPLHGYPRIRSDSEIGDEVNDLQPIKFTSTKAVRKRNSSETDKKQVEENSRKKGICVSPDASSSKKSGSSWARKQKSTSAAFTSQVERAPGLARPAGQQPPEPPGGRGGPGDYSDQSSDERPGSDRHTPVSSH